MWQKMLQTGSGGSSASMEWNYLGKSETSSEKVTLPTSYNEVLISVVNGKGTTSGSIWTQAILPKRRIEIYTGDSSVLAQIQYGSFSVRIGSSSGELYLSYASNSDMWVEIYCR